MVVGRPVAHWARLAEARNRAINELRIALHQSGRIEFHLGGDPRPEILDNDVGFRDKAIDDRARLWILQIERDRALAGVVRDEGPAHVLKPGVHGVMAHVVAYLRLLNLDDVRAEKPKLMRAGRPGDCVAQIEYVKAGKRLHRFCSELADVIAAVDVRDCRTSLSVLRTRGST